MILQPLRKDLQEYLRARKLEKKWDKARVLFERDMRYPSLATELLEPRWRGIYSCRIDKKYRALFFIRNAKAEVFSIMNHYKKQ